MFGFKKRDGEETSLPVESEQQRQEREYLAAADCWQRITDMLFLADERADIEEALLEAAFSENWAAHAEAQSQLRQIDSVMASQREPVKAATFILKQMGYSVPQPRLSTVSS